MQDEFWKTKETPEIDKRKEEIDKDDNICPCANPDCSEMVDKRTAQSDWDGYFCQKCAELREDENPGFSM